MAWRFENVYERNIKVRGLDPSKLKVIIKVVEPFSEHPRPPKFRLNWGAEYGEFLLKGGSLLPTQGTNAVIDRKMVLARPYSPEQFSKLATSCNSLQLLERDASGLSFLTKNDYFDLVKIVSSKDYPKMVEDLEKEGYLKIIPSQNYLATDPRRFKLAPKSVDITESLREYGDTYYEIDSLGTTFFSQMSLSIEELWRLVVKTQLKDSSAENNGNSH